MKYSRCNIKGKFQMTMHTHPGVEIDHLVNGTGYYIIGNEKVSMHKGDILLLDPSISHQLVIEDTTAVLYCVECYEYKDKPKDVYIKVRSDNLMREILLDMISVNYLNDITDSAFKYLCELIFRNQKSDKTEEIGKYIIRNYMNDLTIEIIAKDNFISPAQLQRSFKKKFGIPIGKYITKIRMFEAKNIILNTDIPIGEIDSYIGMKSRNSFTKAFKKEFGVSPIEMRKRK